MVRFISIQHILVFKFPFSMLSSDFITMIKKKPWDMNKVIFGGRMYVTIHVLILF